MKPFTLDEAITALEGTCDRQVSLGSVSRVITDSRQIGPGDLFIAIGGERFDGHDFVGQAFAAGAIGAVVKNDFDLTRRSGRRKRSKDMILPAEAVLIRVDDPVTAMGRLARYYRRSILGGAVTVVAVTGSNGKTTTKAMIAHVLGARWKGNASIKSYNNAIGVPLTLLSADQSDSFLVCELGTNAPGEIAALAKIVEPEVGVITGVAEVHLAGLGSLEKIADEKLSMLSRLKPDGCVVVNFDQDFLRCAFQRDRELNKIKRVTFGEYPEVDLRLSDVRIISATPDAQGRSPRMFGGGLSFKVNDRFEYRLKVPGRHNIHNALAAIGVARRFGMDHDEIIERLASFKLPPMRLEHESIGDLTLINDAYNANPASLRAAVDVLADMPVAARRVLVVGDMRELGRASQRLHVEAAEYIARCRIGLVIAVGENSRLMAKTIRQIGGQSMETHAYTSTTLAKRRIVSHLRADDTILVKGSRALSLEILIDTIRDWVRSVSPKRLSRPTRRASA
ncbi:MAG: UDP-N-acetylmuramoyl-tripeptide--D-alanyl-D-alanine ligase [Planctomycetota bacterium]|nr:MAG: UDP-N-acetylmuramoyl-tripeptide--D-alanyl-D-alanine ligase [Planctomycetota bacterium]